MPAFAFTARGKDGKAIQGVRVAASEAALASALAAEAAFLVRAQPAGDSAGQKGKGKLKLKRKELAAFLLHLASYVEAGVPILAALQDYRLNQFARLIVQHELRPQQVWPALIAASKVHTMAGPAMDPIKRIAGGNQRRIARRPLLRRKARCGIASAAASRSLRARRRRRSTLCRQPGSDTNQNQKSHSG